MATTTDLITQAAEALKPRQGFHQPHQDQVDEATARGVIALAQALHDLNTTLTDLAEIDALTDQHGTPDPCQEADLLPSLTTHHTADVVCIRGGDVLMIERGWPPHQGQLALPGGHVDPGETPRAAAARELIEETGVLVNPDDLTEVGEYDAPGRDPRGQYVTTAYVIRVPADTTAKAGDDAAAVRWVPLTDPGNLAFDHNQIVTDAYQALAGTTLQPATHHSA